MTMEKVFVTVQLLLVMIGFITAASGPITCKAGEFSRCTNASITCLFQENIRVSRKNFNIVQYPFNKGISNSDSGTYVLVCNWGAGDSLDCKTEDGFTFNKQVSDKVTLYIPDVLEKVGGVYVCQVVPDSGVPLETCTLRVKNFEPPALPPACPPVNCGKEDLVIALLVLIVVVLIILFVFVIIYLKKRYHFVQKKGDPTKDSCICCGMTCNIERRHPKRPKQVDSSSSSNKDAGNIALVGTAAVFTNNETGKEKMTGHTKETAPLLLAGSDSASEQKKPEAAQTTTKMSTPHERSLPAGEKSDKSATTRTEHVQGRDHNEIISPSVNKSQTGQTRGKDAEEHGLSIFKGGSATELSYANFKEWTTDDVTIWLREERFDDSVIDLLRTRKVLGILFSKTPGIDFPTKLKELGITDPKTKQLLHKAVKELREKAEKLKKQKDKK